MDDAIACCEKCGVVPPTTLYADQQGALEDDLSAPTHSSLPAADTIVRIEFPYYGGGGGLLHRNLTHPPSGVGHELSEWP